MKLTQEQLDIYSGKTCPYCGGKSVKREEEYIYGKTFKGRKLHVCENYPKCDSYVGSHKEDETPLGRLAKKELRLAKSEAHKHFDKLWRDSDTERTEMYQELSEYLDIPIEFTHIGMFNADTCKKVVEFSKQKTK